MKKKKERPSGRGRELSVAFITMGGITPLLQTLKELENKGIPGEVLTTNYLNFSEPSCEVAYKGSA